MAAVGLKTHIWNNNIFSVAMLFVLPVALVLWFWGLFMVWQVFSFVVFPISLGNLLFGGIEGFFLHLFSAALNALHAVVAQLPLIIILTLVWYAYAFINNVEIIRKATGAEGVSRSQEPELYNILENLAISRTMVLPKLSIIETDARNAFASGIDNNSYNITVTRGLIASLSHNELEAVIAHELTHIQNNDTRLMMIITIFSGALLLIIDRIKAMNPIRLDGDARLGVLLGGILMITRLSSFITSSVKYFVSRRREYMADAGSIELTNRPDALVMALVKIENNAVIPQVSAMLSGIFIMPVVRLSKYSSHPSVEERVKALRDFAGSIVTTEEVRTLRQKAKEVFVSKMKAKSFVQKAAAPVSSWKSYIDSKKTGNSKTSEKA